MFYVYSLVQHYEYLPGGVLIVCIIIPMFKQLLCLVSPSFPLGLQVWSFRKAMKHFSLLTWSDDLALICKISGVPV